MSAEPWAETSCVEQTQRLLDSFEHYLQRELIPRTGTSVDQSQLLYHAPFIVVSHNTEADPILDYGNVAALELWETDRETLLSMPSRKTAEPVHRDERAALLKRVTDHGFIDDYAGIRISATGKRFRIANAIVWNLLDQEGEYAGQAATFSEWELLE